MILKQDKIHDLEFSLSNPPDFIRFEQNQKGQILNPLSIKNLKLLSFNTFLA